MRRRRHNFPLSIFNCQFSISSLLFLQQTPPPFGHPPLTQRGTFFFLEYLFKYPRPYGVLSLLWVSFFIPERWNGAMVS